MKKRLVFTAALFATIALSLTIVSALGAGGRLALYLVNSGPDTAFYNEDGDCARISKPASLSTSTGADAQYDSPAYQFSSTDPHPSTFSYAVPAGEGFTVPASSDAVILKLWAFSGDGSCDGQEEDQLIDWRVTCTGSCGTGVSLTGPGQTGRKAGWLSFEVPVGTPVNSLFNVHAGPPSEITVGAGDVITLQLSADTWPAMQWSAPRGAGVSSISILGR